MAVPPMIPARRRRRVSVLRLAAAMTAILGLAACAVPRATVDPAGRLDILGPGPGFSPTGGSGEWSTIDPGDDSGPQFVTVETQGIRSLRVVSGRKPGVLFRHIDAILVVAPYLSWNWNVEPHADTVHPVRLIAGFYGGNPESGSWGSRPLAWLGSDLPPYDRMLSIGWDASALRRGSMSPPRKDGRAPRHYTVRGGEENTGAWRLETVDLAQIYRQAWPDDDVSRVKIMFIGIAAVGSEAPAAASFSGLVLSR